MVPSLGSNLTGDNKLGCHTGMIVGVLEFEKRPKNVRNSHNNDMVVQGVGVFEGEKSKTQAKTTSLIPHHY